MIDEERKYLPLFFNLQDLPCLVVGGGKVAHRKIEQLLQAGAKVTIIAPQIAPELSKLLAPNRCLWLKRKYQPDEASFYRLVIATTDDPESNRQIYEDCLKRGIPVNVVDQPELCSVIFPSIIRRDPVTIAISSGGKIPFFTKYLRKRLTLFLDGNYFLEKAQLLVKFREFVKKLTVDQELQARAFQRLLSCSEEKWATWSQLEPPYSEWATWLSELQNEQS